MKLINTRDVILLKKSLHMEPAPPPMKLYNWLFPEVVLENIFLYHYILLLIIIFL